MSSLHDDQELQAFPCLETLIIAFTDDDGSPKVFHGMGTMVGIYPVNDDEIHWFGWVESIDGFQHQFSTTELPNDLELMEVEIDDE